MASSRVQASLSEPRPGPYLGLSLGMCVCILCVHSLAWENGRQVEEAGNKRLLMKNTWARITSCLFPCTARAFLTPRAQILPGEAWGTAGSRAVRRMPRKGDWCVGASPTP